MKKQKRGFKIPEVLTDPERTALLSIPNKRYNTGLRNYCIMLVMLDAGLRTAEVINLKCKDVNFQTGKIKVVQGKGRKDRYLWINEQSLEWLRKWRERKPESVILFPTLKGEQIKDSYLRASFARMGKKAGIDKRVHPHMLRHSFGTDLYRETKNIRMVQKALGHADLSTTMIYTHIVDDELENGMKNFRNSE